jgi:hypothetical protein
VPTHNGGRLLVVCRTQGPPRLRPHLPESELLETYVTCSAIPALSAILTLPDYGRVARHPLRMANSRQLGHPRLSGRQQVATSTLSWWTNEELGKLRCMFERLALSTEIAAALCQEGTALGSRWHDRHLRANVRRKYTTNFAPAPCRRSLKIGAVRFLD